jgi:ribosomal protein L23
MNPTDVIKRPIALTEKAARLRESSKVVFEVALGANKIEIRQAVEALFSVKVAEVNTLAAWTSAATGRRRSSRSHRAATSNSSTRPRSN